MTDKQTETLAAVLANIVTKHSGKKDIFDAHLETLSIAERGWVYENVMKYPAGIDLAEVISGTDMNTKNDHAILSEQLPMHSNPKNPLIGLLTPFSLLALCL